MVMFYGFHIFSSTCHLALHHLNNMAIWTRGSLKDEFYLGTPVACFLWSAILLYIILPQFFVLLGEIGRNAFGCDAALLKDPSPHRLHTSRLTYHLFGNEGRVLIQIDTGGLFVVYPLLPLYGSLYSLPSDIFLGYYPLGITRYVFVSFSWVVAFCLPSAAPDLCCSDAECSADAGMEIWPILTLN